MKRSALILIVDDDAMIRQVMQETLEDDGYKVETASSGAQAVAILEAGNPKFHALVTDIDLPPGTLTGWEVAQWARELNAALPVIYMTGTRGHEPASHAVPHSITLIKPFALSLVVTAVSKLLRDAASGAVRKANQSCSVPGIVRPHLSHT